MYSIRKEAKLLKQRIISRFNLSGLKEIQKQLNIPSDNAKSKYFNADYEFSTKCEFAIELGLDKVKNLNILDISCGMGYFAYVCKFLGHHVTVTDVDEKIYDEPRSKIFQIQKITFKYPHRLIIPLPENIGIFNLITAFSVDQMSFWKKQQWDFFIDDSIKHLVKGGLLYIRPNDSPGLTELKEIALSNIHYRMRNMHSVTFVN